MTGMHPGVLVINYDRDASGVLVNKYERDASGVLRIQSANAGPLSGGPLP